MTLAYEGLHGTATDNTSVAGLLIPAQPTILHSSFTQPPYLAAEGKTETSYDAGDLLFGQKMDVGQRIRLHPFLLFSRGCSYATIDFV